MSVDVFQEKIRKTKNPTVVELGLALRDLPPKFSADAAGYGAFCKELLYALKGVVPAVRVSFAAFAMLGCEGMQTMTEVLKSAASQGFYVILDAPEILSVKSAEMVAAPIQITQ